MPLVGLILLFIAIPLAELYVILEVVGPALGAPLTILLLAADSVIGSLLLKSQGRTAWRRFNEAMAEGRIPAREVVDGALIIFGGAFLITPGFITDIFGLLLLLPPTRALFRRVIVRFFTKRTVIGFAGSRGAREYERRRQARRGGPGSDDVVEGEAHEDNEPVRRLDP